MTLDELIAAYRFEASDKAKPYLCGDDEIVRLLNEAEIEACHRARLISDSDSTLFEFDFSAGANSVSVSELITEITSAVLTDSSGTESVLEPTDRYEMDYRNRFWRTDAVRPTGFIHEDKTITLNSAVDADYTMTAEGFRLPKNPLSASALSAEPEIAEHHHRHLLDWVLYRVFSTSDAELQNTKKAESYLASFEHYFGPRPSANLRRRHNANRPHHNKCVW